MLSASELSSFRATMVAQLSATVWIRRKSLKDESPVPTASEASDGYGRVKRTAGTTTGGGARTDGYHDHAYTTGWLQLRDRVGVGPETYADNIEVTKEIGKIYLARTMNVHEVPFPVEGAITYASEDTILLPNDRLRVVKEGATYDPVDTRTFDEYDVMYVQNNSEQATVAVMVQAFRGEGV